MYPRVWTGRPRKLPIRIEAFSRFKESLETHGFLFSDDGRADRLTEARQDFGAYRIKVVVSASGMPERSDWNQLSAEAEFICHRGGNVSYGLPLEVIRRAFPFLHHGNISLRFEETRLEEIRNGEAYRTPPGGTYTSDYVDTVRLLRAGRELMCAMEEARRIIRGLASASSKGAGGLTLLDEMTARIRDSRLIESAIVEHVPDF